MKANQEIEVCFGVDDYPGESEEWMDAMVPLRRVVERRRDLAYLRLTKRGWRNHLIFEAFLWSAQGNQHINSIELDRLLLSSLAVADWMCKSTQVSQFNLPMRCTVAHIIELEFGSPVLVYTSNLPPPKKTTTIGPVQ